LPVGYGAVVRAYRRAVERLTVHDLTAHYTKGLEFFREEFAPRLKSVLAELSGGVWRLDEYEVYAAGSDVDLMTHLVEAVAARQRVCLYPGDWFGFRVGCTHTESIVWDRNSEGALACLCVPSVRNGHLTEDMAGFLESASACLLNVNLFPTLDADQRRAVAQRLSGVMEKSFISVSFSRGFGLTASQLGVGLIHRGHPYREQFARQWEWFTYFHNALAASAFLEIDLAELQAVDALRRRCVLDWLGRRQLPVVATGSYYVKSFRLQDEAPEYLQPLVRDNLVRLCFKPPVEEEAG
jgi:hypothetical protein